MTMAEALRPSIARKRMALLYDVALVTGGSIFVALAARIAIPLPFSPVPITGQTLAVLLVGALLGSKRGALSLLLYLLEGALGLPVFAGGTGGLVRLLGPTGGYLIGFVAAAFVTGWLAEHQWDRRFWSNFVAMLIGNLLIYLFGLSWLAHYVGLGKVLALGFYPFIPGDLIKLIIATAALPSGWKLKEI
ncbi:MAG TPA: biotin transporter BioY [Chloroflexi bacterium]|nr:biotin transporter BioY [Chloroflexota bacterium]